MDRRPFGRRDALLGVLVITVAGLLARLFSLGFRVLHWDEGRVGFWILRYMDTGGWEYQAILHGPFLFHANAVLFDVAGATDFNARILVALVGGLLPLSVWLFREHLGEIELVAAAGFLALNPVLLYYSRFMRNDVLVATFGLFTVGFFLRLWYTGRHRYLYAGVFTLALGFATKEIVVVYLAVWVGAIALLLDHRLFAARANEEGWQTIALDYGRDLYRWIASNRIPLAVAAVEFVVLIVVFYAPRPDLYLALSDPARLPGVIDAATFGSWEKLESLWISGGHEHSYVAFLRDALETAVLTSLPLTAFAIVGFVVDRYAGDRPRDLVSFCFYWGFAIFFIYPAITDISAPWSLVHAMVPLAIPAGVGIGLVVGRGLDAHSDRDWVGVALAAIVVLAVVSQIGVTAIETSYRNPQADSNPLVQYGQPAGMMQDTLADVEAISQAHDGGPDVLFYGDHFYVENESVTEEFPAVPDWLNRMPLPWYLERSGAVVDSSTSPQSIDGDVPVIITRAEHYDEVNRRLSGYDDYTYELTSTGTETVFFVDRSYLNETESTD